MTRQNKERVAIPIIVTLIAAGIIGFVAKTAIWNDKPSKEYVDSEIEAVKESSEAILGYMEKRFDQQNKFFEKQIEYVREDIRNLKNHL